ncbi:DUF3817 domain-containing protein [Metabacillus arenae]|uniref:DUF3817 domain-containing protein n=1 Tax=Metabacillus arenae TaxID=2771434 RepID=A0A926RWA5_9BACI|nr:DUF3817 domain-containing protein [Metabacillus arenae]MBD1379726.1 DUF3817 domain-containing protein [Metabacillus arenae]
MLKTAIGRLRVIGILEGISYLVLLGIAMPLKHFMDIPMAVTIAGGLHGGLFVLFVLSTAEVKFRHKWSFLWAIGAVIASVIPFGTFVLDRQLKERMV